MPKFDGPAAYKSRGLILYQRRVRTKILKRPVCPMGKYIQYYLQGLGAGVFEGQPALRMDFKLRTLRNKVDLHTCGVWSTTDYPFGRIHLETMHN